MIEWDGSRPCMLCHNAPAVGVFQLEEDIGFGNTQTHVMTLCGTCALTAGQMRKSRLVGRGRDQHFISVLRYLDVKTLGMFEVKPEPTAPKPERLTVADAVGKAVTTNARRGTTNTRYFYKG